LSTVKLEQLEPLLFDFSVLLHRSGFEPHLVHFRAIVVLQPHLIAPDHQQEFLLLELLCLVDFTDELAPEAVQQFHYNHHFANYFFHQDNQKLNQLTKERLHNTYTLLGMLRRW
jgi:hypothetical protein